MTQNQPNLPKGLMAMYVQPLVNQLIESKAMALKARQMGLRVSDQELGDSIQTMYSAQVGTAFDPAMYQRVVESQGMTVPAFETQQREMMLAARLESERRDDRIKVAGLGELGLRGSRGVVLMI